MSPPAATADTPQTNPQSSSPLINSKQNSTHNPHLVAARTAVLALIHAGISPNDPRVETLLTLISKGSSSSQTFQKQNLQQQSSPSNFIKPSILTNNQPTFSNLTINPSGLQLPTNNPSLQHTQCAIVTARAATYPNTVPSHSSPHSNQPPSVFRTARTLTTDVPSSSNRKPRKDVKTSPNNHLLSSPHTQQSTPDSELDIQSTIPFASQVCGDISAEHTFQIKAQVEAYRRLLKGMPIPPVMLTAANGAPSSKPPIKPQHGPLVVRGAPDDLPSTQISTQAYLIPQEKQHFDPRLLPRFDDDHEFTKQDVVLPHEKYAKIQLDEQEINRRILLAKTHHRRISKLRMNEGSISSEDEKFQAVTEASFDPALKQHFAQLLNTENIIKKEDDQVSTLQITHTNSKQNHCERKSPRRRKRSLPTIPDSALRLQAAAPIVVETKLTNAPNPHELKIERDRRIAMRVQGRAEEINELLKTAQGGLRENLLKEQKAIRLIGLQRSVRSKIMACMHKTLNRPGISDIRKEKIARMRRPPIIYTYADPHLQKMRMAAPRNAMAYRNEQQLRRHHRHANTMKQLLRHKDQLQSFFNSHFTLRKKLMKDLERYFRDKSREEERRKKREQIDRLRALRNNNEDEYLELLKTTKNKRLIQLLKQTDEYLVQIGAQVERQKQTARESGETNDFNESQPSSSNMNDENEMEGDQEKDGSGEDDELNQLKKRRNDYYTITHTISEKVYQPKCLIGGKLKHYQLEGLEWLVSLYNNNLNGILADEMGLGKTIQTISLITYLVEVKKMHGPFLVIVPLSVMSNWVRELDKWAPSLTKVTYKGDPITRRNIKFTEMDDKQYNVLLTTYEFVTKDKHVLGRIRWKYIIMDEGHRLKNAECKLALTLGAKYTSRNRLLLTGTPLQNNMTELWALLNFLLPSIFSSAETFETWFNAPFQASALGGSAELDEEENLLIISRLHQVLRPFMLRRLKTDVETQLPDKVEIVFRCEMSIWQRVLYRQMRGRLGIAAGAGNVATRSFNNMVMQLKKVCNHPFLFYNEEELMSIPREFLMRAAGKFELLDHVLKKLKRAGHRVLIFSQMTAALDYLEYFLNTIGMKNLRLDGTTKADDRQEMLELFNAENSEYFCFLLSTRAGGLGLNLQTADTVIIFDSDWNPMMDLQAQDRAHRIGQTKEVRVFRLICSGSIEVKILERANRKLQIDAQVIQAGQFNNKSSHNDRQEMLKDLLRQQTGDDKDAVKDVSARTDVNRQLARSEDEFKLFEEIDGELAEEANGKPRLVVDENELPSWVLKPEKSEKDKIVSEAEFLMEHGRGRRKRKEVVYNDNLTEREWAQAMEEDGDISEAVKRKKRKLTTDSNDSDIDAEDAEDADDADEIEQQITDHGDTPSQENGVVEQEESGGTNVEEKTKEDNSSDKADGGESGSNSKLEPFVDPDLHREPRAKRKRGRPKKSGRRSVR